MNIKKERKKEHHNPLVNTLTMRKSNKSILHFAFIPHLVIIISFAIISLLFYYPLLSGKVLFQSDIRQYEGMSRQLKNHRAQTGKETYWIDNAFGGMPTYQLGAKYPADFLNPIYSFFRILPRPAHILFIYLLGFYLLMTVLKFPWQIRLFGSMAFGFSTYLLIILQVGHNTKALAISFIPFVIAGMLLLFRKQWFWGFVLTSLSLAMQIRSNHYQMTYYLLFLMGIFLIVYGYYFLKNKEVKFFATSVLILLSSVILSLGLNSTPLLATAEYAKFSTRGESELTINPDGTPKEKSTGLDFNYITEYSYGIFETLNLIAPRIQGGASRENLGREHGVYDFLIKNGVSSNQALQFSKNVPTYWGEQPILEAPAYVGISVFFFALFSLFFINGPLRNALAIGVVFALILSWGKNLSFVTEFFIKYVPFYNKFRAVSSIQVILEFCLPVLSAIGIHNLYFKKVKIEVNKVLKIAAFPILLLVFVFISQGLLSFTGINDSYYRELYGNDLLLKIREARVSIFKTDILRAIIFCILLASTYFLFHYDKIKKNMALGLTFILMLIDLLGVANRYIDRKAFVNSKVLTNPFQITKADQTIQNDKTRFRVFEPRLGLTGARTSYFHNSLGGYHGAKPRRFQELIDTYKVQQNTGILDFLNVKYVIYPDEESGELKTFFNSGAIGSAWFINEIDEFKTPDELLKAMDSNNFKKTALILEKDLPAGLSKSYANDSLSEINLEKAKPNYLLYKIKTAKDAFAVFSEMYYPKGWKVFIDDKEKSILNVNYVLRGLNIPANSSKLEFIFEPEIVKKGTYLRWISLFFFISASTALVYFQYFRKTT